MEKCIHDGGSAGVGKNLTSQPDKSSGRHVKLKPDAAGAVIDHFDHLAFSSAELFDHDAKKG